MLLGRCSVALLLTLLPLSGCKSKPASNALIPIVFQTDWYPQPEMGGFYEAERTGLYKAQGLDVTIAPGGPYVAAEQQIATGKAQFAMASSDQVLVAAAKGLPVVAVAATMQQDPQAIMVHAHSPVQKFEDLDARTVAIRPGATWFMYLLKRYNLRNTREIPATYSVANFLADPNYIQQAFVTSEPYFARKGGAEVRTLLINSTGYQPYRVVFTSKQFLAEHPDVVANFVKASLAGWRSFLVNPAATNAVIKQRNPAMSTDQMQFTVDILKSNHFIDGEETPASHLGHFTPERWATMYKQLLDLQVISQPIDPTTAYTTQFVP